MKSDTKKGRGSGVIPTGLLMNLSVSQIKPSRVNPRQLFDPEPLKELRESIRQHGVLVPITVYKIKGQDKYAILDGERRYRCGLELEKEGLDISIPANIVKPPTKVAGLLYMFSIHSFREQWELMPTALSLDTIMKELDETDNKKLSKLTGLSVTSIERCKILLTFPEEFQSLSLLSNPKERIPSNFWIEGYPVIKIYENRLNALVKRLGRDVLINRLIQKYRDGKITSIIHFRRIIEAEKRTKEKNQIPDFVKRLEEYIEDPKFETRDAFDEFLPQRNVASAFRACDDFVHKLQGVEQQLITDSDQELIKRLEKTKIYINNLLEKMADSSSQLDDE